MGVWNFGDMIEGNAQVLPADKPALIHGERVITWSEMDRRSNALARALIAGGAKPGDKVAHYMRNRPEYMETMLACFKARLVHVNINYRYLEDELLYIFDNSDAVAVVYGGEFRDSIAKLHSRLPLLKTLIEVQTDETCADFAQSYEEIVGRGDQSPLGNQRSPDDQLFIYTGGTTGMPKGVMWRQDDIWAVTLRGAIGALERVPTDIADHVQFVKERGGGPRIIPAPPLMHGTGMLTALSALVWGGSVVTLTSPNFDAHELWETAARHSVTQISIVGDAFAKPMLRALDERPGAYDLSALTTIVSSGVMFSREVKQGLLRHIPHVNLIDSWGSSEAVGLGLSIMNSKGEVQTAKFRLNDNVKVFTEDGREVVPGSGEPGMIARPEPIPLGYYKDPEKTAKTFRTINGVRYSIPGDWCFVEADGTLTLLGRGSVCINTGGEKVYPEEVEEVLKTHADVEDALVVGVPDEKWGQAVTAVVTLRRGVRFDEESIRQHVRKHLAGYKTPKRILPAGVPLRAPNGKADYKGVTDYARSTLAA